jgi:heme-degrading monooxygenase HmoA
MPPHSPAERKVRVLLYATSPSDDPVAVETAYHLISRDLVGTPGLLGNELLRSVHQPADFVVVSDWESLAAFHSWEQGCGHRGTTAPLRPYQSRQRGAPFGIYEVMAAY